MPASLPALSAKNYTILAVKLHFASFCINYFHFESNHGPGKFCNCLAASFESDLSDLPIFQRSAQGKTITSCTKSGMQKNREAGLDSDWDKSKIGGNKIGSTTKVPCHLACCITCPREVPLFFPKHDKLSITYEDMCSLSKRCFALTLWLRVPTWHPTWCLIYWYGIQYTVHMFSIAIFELCFHNLLESVAQLFLVVAFAVFAVDKWCAN